MFLTILFGGLALGFAIASAICFSAAGAAAEAPHRWHIDAFSTETIGAVALALALLLALAMGLRI